MDSIDPWCIVVVELGRFLTLSLQKSKSRPINARISEKKALGACVLPSLALRMRCRFFHIPAQSGGVDSNPSIAVYFRISFGPI